MTNKKFSVALILGAVILWAAQGSPKIDGACETKCDTAYLMKEEVGSDQFKYYEVINASDENVFFTCRRIWRTDSAENDLVSGTSFGKRRREIDETSSTCCAPNGGVIGRCSALDGSEGTIDATPFTCWPSCVAAP